MWRKLAAFILVVAGAWVGAFVFPAIAGAQNAQSSIGGAITANGQPVNGVSVDLFAADSQGNRVEYLRSIDTGVVAAESGRFEFVVNPGCYSVTAIAPGDSLFANGTQWMTTAVCLAAGESQLDLDAALQTASVASVVGTTLVSGTDVPVDGIAVDLFTTTADGNRGQYLRSVATGADGDPGLFRFELDPGGCFFLTYVAPEGLTWEANGSRWHSHGFCSQPGAVTTVDPIRLVLAERTIEVDAVVVQGGAPVDGLAFDIFAALPDGGRGEYVASGRTSSALNSAVQIQSGATCWVVTLVAAADDQFVDSGNRWLNRSFCADPANSYYRVEAELAGAGASTCAAGGEFELVLRDDFNGSEVSDDWNQYYSAGNAGYGLRRPSAITVENGLLVITADMVDGSFVSGGMSHDYTQQYGKYRFRVRTDRDPSTATSGVILTWPASNAHPRDGENNVYETLADSPDRNPFYSFIHEPFGTVHDQVYIVHDADAAQFQTMTMEWTPERMTITREGPGGQNFTDVHIIDENDDDLLPDNPHYLSIQLDAWRHSIASPVRMEVDWVEVHKYC